VSGPAKPSPAQTLRSVARCDASQSIQRLPTQCAQLQSASLIEQLNAIPLHVPTFNPSHPQTCVSKHAHSFLNKLLQSSAAHPIHFRFALVKGASRISTMEKRKFLFVSLSLSSVTSLGRSSKKATKSGITSTTKKSATSPTVSSPNPPTGKKMRSGPTSSSSMTPSVRVPKPKPCARLESPSSAAPSTPTASKTIAPSARKS